MKTAIKLFAIFALALFGLGTLSAAYATEDFAITDVDFDDPIAPGEALSVELELTNSNTVQDFEDLSVTAWLIDGYGDRVTEKVIAGPLQVQQNSEKTLTIDINVPEDLESGDYTLIVEAEGIWEKGTHRETVRAENLVEVELQDDAFFVQSIKVAKAEYSAGDKVDVAVTVMNNGIEDQSNVVVSVAVPELGVQKSLKIFGTLFAGNSQIVYMTFDLPEDADGGIYTLTATAGNAIARSTSNTNLFVEEPIAVDNTMSNSKTVDLGNVEVGETETITVTVANKDSEAKTYTIEASGDNWADITATPSEFELRPGQSQVVKLSIVAEEAGENTAQIVILEDGNAISAINIEANAQNAITEMGLAIVGLAILLAAVVVYFQFYRNNGSRAGDKAKHIYY